MPCSSTVISIGSFNPVKNGPGTTESTVTLPQSYLISKCAPAEESNFNPYPSTEIDSPKLY